MIEFRMSVVNADRVALAFGGLASKINDLVPVWRKVVAQAIRPWLRQQFAGEGQGAHGHWAALDPDYAERKRRKWGDRPILVASGAMKDDLTGEDNKGELEARRMQYGTRDEKLGYALYHQTGFRTRLGTGKTVTGHVAFVPARRIFDPDDRFKTMIRRAFTRGVADYARSVGFAVAGAYIEPSEAYAVGAAHIRQHGF